MNSLQESKLVEEAQAILGDVSRNASALRAQAEEAGRIEKIWSDLALYLAKRWPFHVLHIIEENSAFIKKARINDRKLDTFFDEVYHLVKEQSAETVRRYPAYIQEICERNSVPLDHTSRHPNYDFDQGFFRVVIDEQRGQARLSNYEAGRLAEFPADLEAVVQAVMREHTRVFNRNFNGEKTLEKIYRQYSAIIKKEEVSEGSSVPIRQITSRLGKNEKGFRTDEFTIDLSRLIESGPFEIDGARLDLQQTKDTSQGILLHGKSSRGYIGFIVFRRS